MDLGEEHRWARTPWRPGSRRATATAIAEVWSGWSGLRIVADLGGSADPALADALNGLDTELVWLIAHAVEAGFLGHADAARLGGRDVQAVRDTTSIIWDFEGDPALAGTRQFESRLVLLVPPLDWQALRTLDEAGRRAAIRGHDRARQAAVAQLVLAGYSSAVDYAADWPADTAPEARGTEFWTGHRARCDACCSERLLATA